MAKKRLVCFPFIDGSLVEYSHYELDDSERERVYNGEKVVSQGMYDMHDKREVVWKPNKEVKLTLHYTSYNRNRSSVIFYWEDEKGREYPMFVRDIDELLKQNIGTSSVRAIWTYVKRGQNYGIKFLRKVKE